jgi:hypothetical protein
MQYTQTVSYLLRSPHQQSAEAVHSSMATLHHEQSVPEGAHVQTRIPQVIFEEMIEEVVLLKLDEADARRVTMMLLVVVSVVAD